MWLRFFFFFGTFSHYFPPFHHIILLECNVYMINKRCHRKAIYDESFFSRLCTPSHSRAHVKHISCLCCHVYIRTIEFIATGIFIFTCIKFMLHVKGKSHILQVNSYQFFWWKLEKRREIS